MAKIELDKDVDLNEVINFATEKHKGQKRDDGREYITHPLRVAKIVDDVKGQFSSNRKVLFAAAVLHDTLEDTYTSYRELEENFGEIVASIVQELTTAKYGSKMIGKGLYLAEKMQMMTNYALTIKLADRYDNLCDLSNCTEEKQKRTIDDTKYILDYLEKRRTFTKSQQTLTSLIKEKLEEFDKNEQKSR